ncbi:MAG: hypothetical protein JXJ17_12425 [Anaerolineae bacterium]|nr:hypothetical protein [Anaerolineae bacterium]
MGKKNLILHIGSPKTGTTALQYTLFDNRERLAQQGICYPAGINLSLGKAHHPFYFAISGKWWDPNFYYEITEERIPPSQYKGKYESTDFIRDLRYAAKDMDRIILSSEGFFELDDQGVSELSEVLKDYDVEIVIYLRRQDKYLEALYRHFVFDAGARFTESIEDYSKHVPNIDYLAKIECWKTHFKTSPLHVIPYERDTLIEQDIVADFASRFNIDIDGFSRVDADINASISNELYQLLLTTNRAYWQSRDMPAEFLWFLKHNLPEEQEKTSLLSPEQRIQLLDRFEESNRQLAERYIPASAGVLFKEPLPKPDQPYQKFSSLNVETIQTLLESAYQQLLDRPPDAKNMILAMLALWKASNHLLSIDVEHLEETEQEIKHLDALRIRHKELTTQYEEATKRLKELAETNESLRLEASTQLQELTEANENLHSEVSRQSEELAAFQEKNGQLASQYDEKIKLLNEMTEANERLKVETAAQLQELSDSRQELDNIHQQFEELNHKHIQMQAYTQALETNVREILWMTETSRKEQASLQVKHQQLTTQHEEATSQLKEMTEVNERLKVETAAQLKELSDSRQELTDIRQQFEDLNHKYDQMQAYNKGLETNVRDILWMTESLRKKEASSAQQSASDTHATAKTIKKRNVPRRLINIIPAAIRRRILLVINVRQIQNSELFDRAWYLQTYPDVAAQRINPIRHYLLHGVDEGRNPNPHFSTKSYLRRYPDVAQSGFNPFVHYIRFGRYEGRIAHE